MKKFYQIEFSDKTVEDWTLHKKDIYTNKRECIKRLRRLRFCYSKPIVDVLLTGIVTVVRDYRMIRIIKEVVG